MSGRERDGGVILINVLAVVAIGSAIVVAMLTLGDIAIERSQRFGDGAQAMAYCAGGETSAIVALRRDGEIAPEVDHQREAWAAVQQQKIAIDGGSFSLGVEDAQRLFNINALQGGGAVALEMFRRIVVALELPPETADRAQALIRLGGPVHALAELRLAGVKEDAIETLSGLVTALPGRTDVNLNSAPESLLGIVLGNPVTARFLVARRDRAGFLTEDDLASANIVLLPGIGFRSNYFRVTVKVTLGEASQTLTSLLQRRKRGGRVEVAAIERTF